jgi:hypothetical protein
MCQEELSDLLASLGRHLFNVAAENLWNVGAKLLTLPAMEIGRSSEGRLGGRPGRLDGSQERSLQEQCGNIALLYDSTKLPHGTPLP